MKRSTVSDCPLCGRDCEDRNGLRVHLHGSHLNSELIDVYLEAVGDTVGHKPLNDIVATV
ncbi:MAG: hypothetical protein V5A62_17305 [Haloarculaceae archaeon]